MGLNRVVLTALILFAFASQSCGQTYRIDVTLNGQHKGVGSCVCIGKLSSRQNWVFLTAGHVLRDGNGATVDGHSIKNVYYAAGKDLASFEISTGDFEQVSMTVDYPAETAASICGFTPERTAFCFPATISRTVDDGLIRGEAGQTTRPGDSGGAVIIETGDGKCLAGIHYGYSCRVDASSKQCESLFVDSIACRKHLTQIYGNCPECREFSPPSIRSRIVERAPRRPLVIVPPSINRPPFAAQGPRGQPGPAGPAGPAGSVDYDQFARAFYERYGDQLKGADGKAGSDGSPIGSLQSITQRLKVLEDRKRRVMIVDGRTNKVLDQEDYSTNDPIILDIRRLLESVK